MNLMQYRSVKHIGATLICAAGMFTASFALAGKSGGGYGGGYGGGGGGYSKEAEFKEAPECEVEGGRIEVWGKVEGPAHNAKVKLLAEGKAETECINPGKQEVEAQGDKKSFDISKVEDIGEIDKHDKEDFDIHAQVHTDAKCEGKEKWKAKTRLDFENDKFTVKLLDKGETVDEATCKVSKYDCECYLSGGGGYK